MSRIKRPDTAFERSTFRSPRRKAPDHLDFIRSLPCCVCLNEERSEAAHIRFAWPRVDKRETGLGEKPDDMWSVPLCPKDHREQHSGSEISFWAKQHMSPILTALALWAVTGDEERGRRIIKRARL